MYLSRLRSLFNIGLIVIAGLTFAGGLIGVWYERASHEAVSSSSSNHEWKYQTEYRLVSSPMSKTAEWIVRVTATNNLDRPLSARRLRVRNRKGRLLPVDITYSTDLPYVITPGQTVVFFAAVKSSDAVMEAVASMDVEIK